MSSSGSLTQALDKGLGHIVCMEVMPANAVRSWEERPGGEERQRGGADEK